MTIIANHATLRRWVAAAALLLPLCAPAQTKIVLGHTGIADYAAAFIAKDQGLFAKHGLDVEILLIPGGGAVSGLQSNSIQISTLPPPTMLLANEAGLDLVALAGCSIIPREGPNPALVVKAGSAIKTAQDLIGKKVAIPSIGGTLQVMTRKWAHDQGADDAKIVFVEASFLTMGDQLRGGTVDAATLPDPFLSRALAAGTGQVLVPLAAGMPPNTTGIVYGSTRAWAKGNPVAVKAFREAIVEAVALAAKNPDLTREAIAKYTHLPPKVVAEQPLPPLKAELSDDQFQFWIDTMRAQGLLKSQPAATALIVR
jgi:NitT/TauT family transport system substrate-binding protein